MSKNRFPKFGGYLRYISTILLLVSIIFISKLSAASITQGYHTNNNVVVGAVVSSTSGSSDSSTSNTIENTTTENEDLMVGVVVDANSGIINLQPKGSDVRVALSGDVEVLVSDINGTIKVGDNLVISQLAGVAMRDTSDATAKKYIAVASEPFDSKSANSKQVSVKQGSQDKNVAVGLIKAKMLLSDRHSSKANPLVRFVEKLAGRTVSSSQIVGSLAVFVTTIAFTGLLLNSTIRGSFISLGRNPLSKPAIITNMIRTAMLALVILIAGLAISYAILLV